MKDCTFSFEPQQMLRDVELEPQCWELEYNADVYALMQHVLQLAVMMCVLDEAWWDVVKSFVRYNFRGVQQCRRSEN